MGSITSKYYEVFSKSERNWPNFYLYFPGHIRLPPVPSIYMNPFEYNLRAVALSFEVVTTADGYDMILRLPYESNPEIYTIHGKWVFNNLILFDSYDSPRIKWGPDGGNSLKLEIKAMCMENLVFNLEFFHENSQLVEITGSFSGGGYICNFPGPSFSVPPPVSEDYPLILGTLRLTPSRDQVCDFSYEFVWKNERKNYVQYSFSLPSVLKGKGRTIPEKIASLQEYKEVDYTLLLVYVATRLALSHTLFGRFSVCFLLQEYYPAFLKLLEESEWKSFLPYFVDSQYGVENYYFLFK
jgi:hypothetical protein